MCTCNQCKPIDLNSFVVGGPMSGTSTVPPRWLSATPVFSQPVEVSESVELTVKFTPDEYARLEAARSGSGMQDTKTGFVKRAAMSAVELLED